MANYNPKEPKTVLDEATGQLEPEKRRGPAGWSAQAPRGVLKRLERVAPALHPAGRSVAQFILEHPSQVMHMSVSELAEAASTSVATVVRVCKEAGMKGFQDFKLALTQDSVEPLLLIHEDIAYEDDDATILRKVFHNAVESLNDTLSVLDPIRLRQAAELILAAERVEFYSVGSTAPVAQDIYFRMLWIGIKCEAVTEILTIRSALVDARVVVIAISHSGSTKEVVHAVRRAKELGARIITITNFSKSPLEEYSDVALHVMARETFLRPQSMASRIAMIAALDALYVYVARAHEERSLECISRIAKAVAENHL
jgi:DNA-binding MurR/RpiR family transcriptional regulator